MDTIIRTDRNGIDFHFARHDYFFVCTWTKTRNGFKHEAKLFQNDIQVSTGKCYYLNRTWESYEYQSVCKQTVCNLIDETTKRLFNQYKEGNNLQRLTQKKKNEICDFSEDLMELRLLYNSL